MSSQPYHASQLEPNQGPYMTVATPNTTPTYKCDVSEKTAEMDVVTPPGTTSHRNIGLRDNSPYRSRQQRQQPSPMNVPSYMAPTQSARAKTRNHGSSKLRGTHVPQWNPSTKRAPSPGSACDSSSSGGGTAAHHAPRSPSPNTKGMRLQSGRLAAGYSPEFIPGEDWRLQTLCGRGWGHDYIQ
uniref:Calmodulin-binding family protein n=1 Tax=Rhizophora mucronata TaxID=61149 RepID=A0A2P2PSP3_RHIMU